MKEKKCDTCKYCKDGECYVLLWAAGSRKLIGKVLENGICALWEPKDE